MASDPAQELPPEELDGEYEDDGPRAAPGVSSRMLRLVGGLFAVHAEVAKQELSRDQSRLLGGIILMVIGLSFLSMLILLLQGFGVWLLTQRGLALGWSLLIVAGVDALLGITAILLARRSLSQPLLPETRALVKRTISTVIS